MENELFKKFDAVMTNLKAVEPSSGFDFEFRKRLREAVARKYEETPFERAARKTAESLRYAFLPRVPALARVAATVMLFMAVGLYVYSVQPASPVLFSAQGIALVQGAPGAEWKEVTPSRKIRTGDVVATKSDSRLDLVLSDKYAIRLRENTKIKIARLTPKRGKGKAVFELVRGMMLVDIEKGFSGSVFTVDTKTAEATALGTKFAVRASEEEKTEVSVLEGKVKVKSVYEPARIMLAKGTVTVAAGQKTEVLPGEIPAAPERLMEEEWRDLEELYQIGRKPRVMLLVKYTPERVRELLRPCPIYISDEKPREIPELLDEAVLKIEEALKTGRKETHLESVKLLERIVDERPNPKYDVQFLLYAGAYYEYLGYHKEAIRAFEKVLEKYPNSSLASLAQCAIGVVYEEKLSDAANAEKAYSFVLQKYPDSLEAIWVERKRR